MVFAFLGGLFLGGIFFGGLYYTSKKVPRAKNPALLMLLSLSLRMTILISGLYFIFSGDIIRLLIAIAGVFVAKYLILHLVKREVF